MFVPGTEPGPVTPIVQFWKKGPPSQPKMLSFEGARSEKVKLVHVNPVLFRMSNTPPPSFSTCRPNEPPVAMKHGFVVLQMGSRKMIVGSTGAALARTTVADKARTKPIARAHSVFIIPPSSTHRDFVNSTPFEQTEVQKRMFCKPMLSAFISDR